MSTKQKNEMQTTKNITTAINWVTNAFECGKSLHIVMLECGKYGVGTKKEVFGYDYLTLAEAIKISEL